MPIYNQEKHLRQCIDSLLCQIGDYEIILVDDGSSDDSPNICDEYAKEYDKIRVLHTENNGVGAARNLGVGEANGEYLLFVDSDDYISEGFTERLECSNLSADVIFFESFRYYEKNNKTVPFNEGFKFDLIHKKSKKQVLGHVSRCNKFPGSTCGKIVKKEFIKKFNISFAHTLVGEDIAWCLQLLFYGEKFDYFNGGSYFYRIIDASRSSHGSKKSVVDVFTIINKWVEFIADNSEYKEYFLSFLAYEYAMVYPYFGALSKSDKKELKPEMKKLNYLLDFGKTKKIRLIKLLTSCLGINMSSRLLYKYIKLRDGR